MNTNGRKLRTRAISSICLVAGLGDGVGVAIPEGDDEPADERV